MLVTVYYLDYEYLSFSLTLFNVKKLLIYLLYLKQLFSYEYTDPKTGERSESGK